MHRRTRLVAPGRVPAGPATRARIGLLRAKPRGGLARALAAMGPEMIARRRGSIAARGTTIA
ncbi:hypothetical protein [Roseomonas rosulenta]|uniref:hypothetical protein n=1 Tax=Roseomonas rosulenta TaxID=2748667 RepID=UPI0018DF041B|nr:hypothetical protein [Roseomonas rosulenta]